MNIYNLYDDVMDFLESKETGKGVWWSQCAGSHGDDLNMQLADCVNIRLIEKLPGVDVSRKKMVDDHKLLKTVRAWNTEMGQNELSAALDNAVYNVMGKIAKEQATNDHSKEPCRER